MTNLNEKCRTVTRNLMKQFDIRPPLSNLPPKEIEELVKEAMVREFEKLGE